MMRLLSANFARMKKDFCFWECMGLMAAFGGLMVFQRYLMMCQTGQKTSPDWAWFGYAKVMGILIAVFVSFFLGTEYSDGTIRNKLIVGHRRWAVYLSAWIVNSAAALLMNLAYVAAVCLFGIPFFGFSAETGVFTLLLLLVLTVLMDLAFTSVFTLAGMLCQNKSAVAAWGILSAGFLVLFSGYVESRLNEPRMYETYQRVTDKGYVITREAEENPYYLEGTSREVCEFLDDFLPSSQANQISSGKTGRAGRKSVYACIWILASTGVGIFCFSRKDMK